MKALLRSILGKLRPGGSYGSKGGIMHLPRDIKDPGGILVYSGPRESDVWPALYMTNTLQKAYPDADLDVVCPHRDNGLFNMLRWRPAVHTYSGNPEVPDTLDSQRLTERTVLFYPYSRVIDQDRDFLSGLDCLVRAAPLETPSPLINLVVRTESPFFPEKLHQMCRILGLDYDAQWRPMVQKHSAHAAEQKMAPVTGRMLPYIVTTDAALAILEKSRAEIPLRTVSLAGRKCELSDLDRELKTAIVAGATAVITDNDDLWGDACAFIKWHGLEASHQESEFIEAWVGLLKRGI
jgi:hypothetical protein